MDGLAAASGSRRNGTLIIIIYPEEIFGVVIYITFAILIKRNPSNRGFNQKYQPSENNNAMTSDIGWSEIQMSFLVHIAT